MITRVLSALFGSMLALAGVVAAPAAGADLAPAELHDLRGHFAAFTRGVGNPNDAGIGNPDTRPGSIDITAQVGPVLVGRANLTGRTVAVTGTLSAAGEVSLIGVDGLGLLTIQAGIGGMQPCIVPESDIGGMNPCILEGQFRLTSLLGRSLQGDLVAVHQRPVTGAPSVGGQWRGTLSPDAGGDPGAVEATFAQSGTGAITGRMAAVMEVPKEPNQPVDFDLVGQAGWDGTQDGYSLIGASDGGVIAIINVAFERAEDGTLQPCIVGPVRLRFGDGSVRQARIELDQVAPA